VLLSPDKQDKARSRFDAAHELGHLLMHHDAEPGSRLLEQQAHAFAAEFLAPAAEIVPDLPTRVDWLRLHDLKRRWGISLTALVYRGHALGALSDRAYQSALRQLAAWGYPEPGDLGLPEAPILLPRALELLGGDSALASVARDCGLPVGVVRQVLRAGGADAALPALVL
jgi:Zn-dependent peptidase ImmA (M78 family)